MKEPINSLQSINAWLSEGGKCFFILIIRKSARRRASRHGLDLLRFSQGSYLCGKPNTVNFRRRASRAGLDLLRFSKDFAFAASQISQIFAGALRAPACRRLTGKVRGSGRLESHPGKRFLHRTISNLSTRAPASVKEWLLYYGFLTFH